MTDDGVTLQLVHSSLCAPKLKGLYQRQIRLDESEESLCVGGGIPNTGLDHIVPNAISSVMNIHADSCG